MEDNQQSQPGPPDETDGRGQLDFPGGSRDDVSSPEAVEATRPPDRPRSVLWIVLSLAGLMLVVAAPVMALGAAILATGIAIVATGLYGIARWVLGPLDRAARQTEAPVQFTLADFLCLFILVQIPMAVIHGVFPEREHEIRWLLDIYAWFAFGVVWLASAQRLSRAGIHRQWPRALFLTFVLPSAVFGVVVALPLAFTLVAFAAGLLPEEFVDLNRQYVPFAIIAEIALVAAVYVSGHLTRRIVATAEAETGSPWTET